MSPRIRALLSSALLSVLAMPASSGPLRVITTTPDLGSLVATVGGPEVDVTSLVKGPQDPHSLEPRPSFIAKLHRADLFVQMGMELEQGWTPPLLRSARNPALLPGGPGHLDASTGIDALEVPAASTDRSQGDVHPYGNPHYLTDPLEGVRVAARIRDRLTELRPAGAAGFAERFDGFASSVAEHLVGTAWVGRHGAPAILRAAKRGRLREMSPELPLGGWLGNLPASGVLAVEDHQLWAYFAARFGIQLVGRLEPQPGIAPTTRHLSQVVAQVEELDIPIVLASVYFDPRHARWIAERTSAQVVELAHQPGALPDTPDYLSTIDFNVRALTKALQER
jgi:ABC-type Zn uptake system ZnuABC Zn-binding protein ZnuA